MTVRELIFKLSQFEPTLRVVIDGYEGGLLDVEEIIVTKVVFNYKERDYMGPHEELETAGKPDDDYAPYTLDQIKDAVYIK